MKRLLSILLIISLMLSLSACNKAVKVERHVEKTKTENGEVVSSYKKDEGLNFNKDLVSLKLEDYGLLYINVDVTCSFDTENSDAWILFCPGTSEFETNRPAYDSAVIKKEITKQNESFTLDLSEVRKGEYYIVVVSDLKDEDGLTYVFNLFSIK